MTGFFSEFQKTVWTQAQFSTALIYVIKSQFCRNAVWWFILTSTLQKKRKKKGKREIKQGYWGCHRQGPSGNPRKLLNQTSQLAHTCMVRLFFGSWRNGWGAVLPDLFTILNDHTGPVRILITHQHVHFWHHGNFEILFFNVKLSGRVFPGS